MSLLDQVTTGAPPATAADARRAFAVLMAIADTVRECGRCKAGTVYAALLNHVDSVAVFDGLVGNLVGAGLVRRNGDDLVWSGPELSQ